MGGPPWPPPLWLSIHCIWQRVRPRRTARTRVSLCEMSTMRIEILSRLWRADWHLSALLALLLLVVFVIYPMSLRRPWGDLVLESFLSLILILGAALVAQLRA